MNYILGAGSMAREALNIYRALGRDMQVQGFIEEGCKDQTRKIHDKSVFDSAIIDGLPKETVFIGAIGSPIRKRWVDAIKEKGFTFDTLVHPSVVKGEFVELLEGCIVCPGSVLTCDIEVGRHTILNNKTSVSHDCKIGEFVTVSPGVNIGGKVTVGDGCYIGIGATIINKITIGSGSYVGAGAVVTKNIPSDVLAIGVPAKPLRKMSVQDWITLT
jgi:sugar O-acyltransferase (sialic acid O-acetyltransferase NeuD family)